MKRIGIDARLYFQTGVGVYLRNYLHYLQMMDLTDMEFYVYVMHRDSSKIDFHHPHIIKREVTAKWHSISEQIDFYNILMNDELDLMHFTYFSFPIRYKRPFIATIHDVTPLIHKTGKASTLNPFFYELKYQVYKYVISTQVNRAQKIITPTETVKKELIEVFGKDIEKKTEAIYEGVNYEMLEAEENRELKKTYPNPFLLYVGNFYPHKNVDALLNAYQLLQTNVPLIMAGPDNYFTGELKIRIQKDNIKNVLFHHTAKIEDLIFFYKNAIALVNPSVSEGFGLPLIEAAYFGTPIVASDLPVFRELYGDSYIAFDPTNVEDIKSKLQIVLKKKPEVSYGNILNKCSFEKMSKRLLETYMEILK